MGFYAGGNQPLGSILAGKLKRTPGVENPQYDHRVTGDFKCNGSATAPANGAQARSNLVMTCSPLGKCLEAQAIINNPSDKVQRRIDARPWR